jgi:hypothetical protein
MANEEWTTRWREVSEEVLSGMQEWRAAHPRATFREIEAAAEERLSRLRARLLEDTALASQARAWTDAATTERPACPDCGQPLESRGQRRREVTVPGNRQVRLERSYGVCSACGTELFPPG